MLNMPQIASEAFLPTQSRQRQTPCLTIFHPLGLAALLSHLLMKIDQCAKYGKPMSNQKIFMDRTQKHVKNPINMILR